MHSSSDNDSDVMFPSADHQFQTRDGVSLVDTSDLSPPLSQDAPTHNDTEPMNIGQSQPSAHAQGADTISDSRFVKHVPARGSEKPVEPGATWKSRKAREEYSRALDLVLDKSFNLSMLRGKRSFHYVTNRYTEDFGDPFDEAEQDPRKTR